MARKGFPGTQSRFGSQARLDRALAPSSRRGSACILRELQMTMSAKVFREEKSQLIRPGTLRLLRLKTSSWATSYCMERQGARLISTGWPANDLQCEIPAQWRLSKGSAIM